MSVYNKPINFKPNCSKFILSSPDMGAHFCRKDRGSTSLMQKYDVLDVFLMGASCGSTTGQLNFDSNFWRACSIKSDLSSRSFNFFDKGVLLDFEEVQMAKTPKMPCGQAPTKVYQGPYKLLQFPKRFPCPANLLDTWRSFMILCSGHVLHFLPHDAWHIRRCYFGSCHFNERERE